MSGEAARTAAAQQMIIVVVNGAPLKLPGGSMLADVLARAGAPAGGRGYALALDGEVVPRARWAKTPLRPGARVEVVAAVAGG